MYTYIPTYSYTLTLYVHSPIHILYSYLTCRGQDTTNNDTTNTDEADLVGDPIEVAAIKAVEWTWSGHTSTASPGIYKQLEKSLNTIQIKSNTLQTELTYINECIVNNTATMQQQSGWLIYLSLLYTTYVYSHISYT